MYAKTLLVAFLSSLALVNASPLMKRAGDFGSCSDPTIKFAAGLDGRKENAFAPNNSADFNHGSALNIGVISSFICGQLQSKCKADATAISNCAAAQQAANGKSGQAAADAFNSAITGGANQKRAQNFQTFNGNLGGAPPPVTAGGKGFVVDGSDFVNLNAALGRSCDVQHNACASAANSGGGFSVSQCDAQDTACKAQIN